MVGSVAVLVVRGWALMSGDGPPLVMFVRPLQELVGLRAWVVHVVPVPDPEAIPEVLTAYCGARFAPGTVERLGRFHGMPCNRCIPTTPAPSAQQQVPNGKPTRVIAAGGEDLVGFRYTRWLLDVEPTLTAVQKAAALEAFALEFESVPPHLEPDAGWGANLAYLCRRIARRHRGEPEGEWVPARQRRDATWSGPESSPDTPRCDGFEPSHDSGR
jgi:hypothetical protein